ncbi:MAG: endonuclease [Candidatus Zixiibacteriota bacterium]
MGSKSKYNEIIERIFLSKFRSGASEISFERSDIVAVAEDLGIEYPKNLGDVVYSFRYRSSLPAKVRAKAPKGMTWIIRAAGRGRYRFSLVRDISLDPNENIAETKIPDATPGIVSKHSLSDEQALLAKVRYNRLVDVFTGITCYSLQSHLRTTVPNMGQIETDEIYIGVDKRGVQYVIPVQAKGGKDRLSVVQIEQDLAMCEHKFPELVCRPVGAQFMREEVIALFEFELGNGGVRVAGERHYRLVEPDQVSDAELRGYRSRLSE